MRFEVKTSVYTVIWLTIMIVVSMFISICPDLQKADQDQRDSISRGLVQEKYEADSCFDKAGTSSCQNVYSKYYWKHESQWDLLLKYYDE